MNLKDLPHRTIPPEPWVAGEKIPWSDPEFSARMLQEHLSQDHNAASRRLPIIERQVEWIHAHMLGSSPGKILDLACGPGLYSHRLARLGHNCQGIDFGPASIVHAKKVATQEGLTCQFLEADIRSASYGGGYDLAVFIFGEFNVFHPKDALDILVKTHAALNCNGKILFEVHHLEAVMEIGQREASWSSPLSGLFAPDPHLMLYESFWLSEHSTTVERYFVVETETGKITLHSSTMQGYTEAEIRDLFAEAGFKKISFRDSFSDRSEDSFPELIVITASK
jgi:SAM-dependent methyltransferase